MKNTTASIPIENIITKLKNSSSAPTEQQIANTAIEVAVQLLRNSLQQMKISERYQAWKMHRMMQNPKGKALTLAMADQVFRPVNYKRSANQFRYLLTSYGIPSFLPLHEKLAMRLGAIASTVAPHIVMSAVTAKMRQESNQVILPSEDNRLQPHLQMRKKNNTRMNINQLGEAVLGEDEAQKRLNQVLQRLANPNCEYISVKISAIFSQINLVAYDHTLNEIKNRLRLLYRAAIKHQFSRQDGKSSPKFINLDMEEYRDLHLTCDAFKAVLMEKEFLQMRAGIVLQAYLPDTFTIQKELTAWAKHRIEQGGTAIKIRIVKGANLQMERVEASLHHWQQAPYYTKLEVDANYKRMVTYGCQPENATAVHLGIASHNLFEIAYALVLRSLHEVGNCIEFEMLEGMANHQARAVQNCANGLLLYAPVVTKEDFHSAISYLIRRLDENTAEENFLHDLFGMRPGDKSWQKQKEMFLEACQLQKFIQSNPNRTQDRNKEHYSAADFVQSFQNVADTDWSLRCNQNWLTIHIAKKQAVLTAKLHIPLVIAGKTIPETNANGIGNNPSTNQPFYSYALADKSAIDAALDCAQNAQTKWQALDWKQRSEHLQQVAAELANKRADSISSMVFDAGKATIEADTEVSEAIDFANYYAKILLDTTWFDQTSFQPFGTVVITPPWNFPFAIPCGGILAALMAGNSVILKPAPETVYTAWIMINQLWDAGIPRDVLQFVSCPDNAIGQQLITDCRTHAVILTGAYETAKMFQSWRPELRIFAETSGKNAMIITNAADPDQAIKDLVKGAFGHAGQKCSASSLAIIEADLYDNPNFMRQLKDAASSLVAGPSSNLHSIVTPIIRPAEHHLKRGLSTLDAGEIWLLEPKMLANNPCLWSPGIKINVQADSWYRQTECFGPILGIIRADNLEHAIAIQNNSDFGLTGGIHSLDDREIKRWRETVEVGNAYINRPTTGAIVQRQPFGGWKKSCFGSGAKAGGPNYLSQFGTWSGLQPSQQYLTKLNQSDQNYVTAIANSFNLASEEIHRIAQNYRYWMKHIFSKAIDFQPLHGESNHFCYRILHHILIHAEQMTTIEIALVLVASKLLGSSIELSLSSEKKAQLVAVNWQEVAQLTKVTLEDEQELCARISQSHHYQSLRSVQPTQQLYRAANQTSLQLISQPVVSNGRIELLNYHREQSISECLHRYGNIIAKPAELNNNADTTQQKMEI